MRTGIDKALSDAMKALDLVIDWEKVSDDDLHLAATNKITTQELRAKYPKTKEV
jgi:hypothetical protein